MNSSKILEAVSGNIRLFRLKNRMTQEELAVAVGISTKYLNMIENKKSNPSITIVVKICKALDIDLNSIYLIS